MANELSVFESALATTMPKEEKSALRRYLDRVSGGRLTSLAEQSGLKIRGDHVVATVNSIRQVGEGVMTGAGIAAIEHYVGESVMKVPVDGGVAAAATFGSIAMAGHEVSKDLANIGAGAATLFAHRHTQKLLAAKAGKVPTAKVSGDDDVDPVIAAARDLR